MGRILIACEESQRVTIEFRELGLEAYSCDILPCSGGYPEWHLQQDVEPLLKEEWEMVIAFPPCTHIAVSGAAWFKEKRADGRQQQGIDFFMLFANAECSKIAIENPVGIMSTKWRKPDQIIQPWQFGDNARKKTCLWLKGLGNLEPTNIVSFGEIDKNGCSVGASATFARDNNGKILSWKDPRTAKIRSKTFPGIAKAMANQWGKHL